MKTASTILRARLLRHGPLAVVALGFAVWLGLTYRLDVAVVTLAGAALTWATIPLLSRVLRRRRILVRGGGRSAHRGAVPAMGGIAVFLPFALVAGLVAVRGGGRMPGLLIAGSLVLGLGLLDDLRGVSPKVKFAVQILAGLVLVGWGFRIDALDIPGWRTFHVEAVAVPLTVFWVVLLPNAWNLIDGMDGIAASVAVVALASLVFIRVSTPMAALVTGALLGFLPHNLPRARIFLGDSGSLFLGFLVAVLLIDLPTKGNVPLAVGLCAYPLGDLSLAVLRRFVRGKPLFHGDRSHIHHKLRDQLRSDRWTVLIVVGLSCIGAYLAIHLRDLTYLVILVILWGCTALTLVFLGRVRFQRMWGSRLPFQHLHLVRDFVEGRIRLARDVGAVERALRFLIAEMGLVEARVGGLVVGAPDAEGGATEREVVRFRRGRAEWIWRPDPDEEEALRNEKRAVIHGVLKAADQRVRKLRGAEPGSR